jgi:UrcA family protein
MTIGFSFRTIGLAFAAASTLAAAAPALAQSDPAPISITVRYADLDVGHEAGARTLLQRIRAASVRACGGQPDLRLLDRRADFDQCRASAIGAAIGKVDSPVLTAMAAQPGPAVRVADR